MSTFSCPVVEIEKFAKHPNADTLSITSVEGCPCIFRTGDFVTGDKAVYIPIESVVPLDNPAFAFLKSGEGTGLHMRIKAKKLRGIFSMGILIKAPEGLTVGQDAAGMLGVVKYEEAEDVKFQTAGAKPPTTKAQPPCYDMENYRKFKAALLPDEDVVVTEKIHGTNSRFVFHDGALHCGSHNQWKKDEPGCVWWTIARKYGLAEKLAKVPELVFYGETYGGKIQDLSYDSQNSLFRVFDIYDARQGRWENWDTVTKICSELGLDTVPVLYIGPHREDIIVNLAGGTSAIASHIREGVVVKPTQDRYDHRVGRVIFKMISEKYLLRKNGTERH